MRRVGILFIALLKLLVLPWANPAAADSPAAVEVEQGTTLPFHFRLPEDDDDFGNMEFIVESQRVRSTASTGPSAGAAVTPGADPEGDTPIVCETICRPMTTAEQAATAQRQAAAAAEINEN